MNLDKLEIEIASNTKNATDGINQQIKALDNLKKTASGMKTPNTKISVDSKDVDKATQRVSKLSELLGSLKRIAMYRAVRSAIKAVTEAIKEGLENAYAYSKLVNGNLAKSLDRLTSKTAKFKNQLGAAFGEVIEAFEPILSELLDELTEIAKTLTSLFAMVGSALRTVYTLLKPVIDFALDMLKAIMTALRTIFDYIGQMLGSDGYLVANDISKAWDEANKSAKEYKRTLIGIDEINRLNDAPDVGSMFNIEGLDTPIPWDEEEAKKPLEWADDLNDRLSRVPETVAAIAPTFEPVKQEAAEVGTIFKQLPEWVYALVPAFSAVLVPVFAREPALAPVLSLAWQLAPALQTAEAYALAFQNALNGIRTVFVPLLEQLPFILTFQVQSPIPALTAIQEAIGGTFIPWLLEKFPFIITFEVPDPVPALQTVLVAVEDAITAFGEDLQTLGDMIAEGFEARVVNFKNYFTQMYAEIVTFNAMLQQAAAAFLQTASQTLTGWATSLWDGIVSVFQSIYDFVVSIIQGIADAASSLWSSIKSGAASWNQKVDSYFDNPKNAEYQKFAERQRATTSVMTGINGAILSGGTSLIPALVGAFANGGYVDNGELFLARENGAEMVGTIGGHTGVANNEQITEGIAEGVAYANTAVVGAINQLIAVVQQIDPTVELDGLTVSRQLHQYNRQVNKEAGTSLVMEAMA